VLLDNVKPLAGAVAVPDSSATILDLGDVIVQGERGDTIALSLEADSAALAGLGSDELLIASVGDQELRQPLSAFTGGRAVYRFGSDATIKLHYALSRTLTAAPAGRLQLTQIIGGGAQTISARTPWVSAAGAGVLADFVVSSDAIDAGAPGDYDGVFVGIAPYFLNAGPWPAEFQSNPGHGQSHEITILFSIPVSEVDLTIWDPDFAGNTMTAYDDQGAEISVQGFGFDGLPGHETHQTLQVTGSISKIVLEAATGDYVSYSMQIVPGSSLALVAKCKPPSIVRGEIVDCTAELQPGTHPFTITEQKAVGEGHTFVDSKKYPIDRGQAQDWVGDAVVSTKVTFTADVVIGGKTVTLVSNTAEYAVTTRMGQGVWQRLTLPPMGKPSIDPGDKLKTYPPFYQQSNGAWNADNGSIGTTRADLGSPHAKSPTTGPNQGWYYLGGPAFVQDFATYYSPHLDPSDSVYKQQQGGHVTINKVPFRLCSATDFDQALATTLQHEAVHAAAHQTYFATNDVQAAFEGIHFFVDPTAPSDPQQVLDQEKAAIKAGYSAPSEAFQAPIDATGGPFPVKLGCSVVVTPINPRT
jgi:hypothetical protein